MKGLEDYFVLEAEKLVTEVENAKLFFRNITGSEPESIFFMRIQLSNGKENGSKQKLMDFKKLFLFTKKTLMMKERHSTAKGVFIPLKNRLVSLEIDEPQDHLAVNFGLDDGKSITLRAVDKYGQFLHDVILKKYLAPNLRS